jgi:hypothetical protein
MIKPGAIYRHHKGNLYRVIFISHHTETGEELVNYQAINSHEYWSRPLSMWEEVVEFNGRFVKRFEFMFKPEPYEVI